jgi:hypothetical protein
MRKAFVATYANQQSQAYVLLLFGAMLLLGAWLVHPNPSDYPGGVLLFGVGMLISSFLYPGRLIIASSLATALGVAVFLVFKGLIPGSQAFPTYILAIGIALLAIAFAGRRGYVGRGAVSPAGIVIGVGLIEVLLIGHLTPPWLIPFALSLWFPGLGLLVLGIIYFVMGKRPRRAGRDEGADIERSKNGNKKKEGA